MALLQKTNTLAGHFVLVSKFFTVTFPIEENLKAKIYPCGSKCMYKQHFMYPIKINHSSERNSTMYPRWKHCLPVLGACRRLWLFFDSQLLVKSLRVNPLPQSNLDNLLIQLILALKNTFLLVLICLTLY